jgi:hypothetical protein
MTTTIVAALTHALQAFIAGPPLDVAAAQRLLNVDLP